MNAILKTIVLPTILGAWLGAGHSLAHADCACVLIARLLTPEQIPGEICSDEDLDCADGFLAEGAIEVFGEDILLHITGEAYALEAVP